MNKKNVPMSVKGGHVVLSWQLVESRRLQTNHAIPTAASMYCKELAYIPSPLTFELVYHNLMPSLWVTPIPFAFNFHLLTQVQ